MRPLSSIVVLASLSALAEAPALTSSAQESRREVTASLAAVPQVRDVSAGVSVDLAPRLTLSAGGWSSLDSSQPTYQRGGWLGAQVRVLDRPSLGLWVRARGLALQPADGERLVAGLAADAHTTMRVTSWFSLEPEFELLWMPPDEGRGSAALSRLSLAYRFHSGAWTIDAIAGAQAWFFDEATLAPFGALAVDWRGRFDRVDVGVGGGVALSRDGWGLVGHPLLRQPTEVLQPWLFARVSITPRFAW